MCAPAQRWALVGSQVRCFDATLYWFGQGPGPGLKQTVKKATGERKPSSTVVLRFSAEARYITSGEWQELVTKPAAAIRKWVSAHAPAQAMAVQDMWNFKLTGGVGGGRQLLTGLVRVHSGAVPALLKLSGRDQWFVNMSKRICRPVSVGLSGRMRNRLRSILPESSPKLARKVWLVESVALASVCLPLRLLLSRSGNPSGLIGFGLSLSIGIMKRWNMSLPSLAFRTFSSLPAIGRRTELNSFTVLRPPLPSSLLPSIWATATLSKSWPNSGSRLTGLPNVFCVLVRVLLLLLRLRPFPLWPSPRLPRSSRILPLSRLLKLRAVAPRQLMSRQPNGVGLSPPLLRRLRPSMLCPKAWFECPTPGKVIASSMPFRRLFLETRAALSLGPPWLPTCGATLPVMRATGMPPLPPGKRHTWTAGLLTWMLSP